MTFYRFEIDYTRLTYRQMADIIQAIWREIKRRNPLGVNLYMGAFRDAYDHCREIHSAELTNPTSEAGPNVPKRKTNVSRPKPRTI